MANSSRACMPATTPSYDGSTPTWPNSNPSTPDIYAEYPLTGMNYLNGVTAGGNCANFFNQQDYALRNWIIDQKWKPDHGLAFPGYWYDGNSPTTHPSGFYKIAGPTDYNLNFTDNAYEIFAYCVQSQSYALGATADVAGFGAVDLSGGIWPEDQFDKNNYSTHPWHSGQFLFSTVEQSKWWKTLKQKLGI